MERSGGWCSSYRSSNQIKKNHLKVSYLGLIVRVRGGEAGYWYGKRNNKIPDPTRGGKSRDRMIDSAWFNYLRLARVGIGVDAVPVIPVVANGRGNMVWAGGGKF